MMKPAAFAWSLLGASGAVLAWAGLSPAPAVKGQVDLYWSTDCPVAMRTAPRVARLIEEYSDKGFEFTIHFPNDLESRSEAESYLTDRGITAPIQMDLGAEKALADGIEVLPAAVVRGPDGGILYRGAIDDNKVGELVKASWLKDALDAVMAGQKPEVAEAEAYGCFVMPGDAPPALAEVNYAEHVASILNDHCVECHRPGDVAPFSLNTYAEARKWSRMIDLVTKRGTMPPWPAAPGIGEFHGENRLNELELETLARWAAAGAPEGDPAKAPKPPTFPEGWALGKPDIELSMPEKFELGPEGQDEYWNFVLDPGLTEEAYVTAIDVAPGNKKVVHHVIAYIDEKGEGLKRLERPGSRSGGYLTGGGGVGFNPDGSLGGWAPGVRAQRFNEGSAFVLKPGAKIVLQIHYHKTGKPEFDQTKIALYTTPVKPERPIQVLWAANPFISIPPNNANASFRQTIPIPATVELHALMPHMHLLGKEMKATLIHPDGRREPLVHVPRWDFNWQLVYHLREPKRVERGSRLEIEAVYDNSADNPNNPHNPPKVVRWGEETTDEMMLLVVMYSPAR
jgi:mono/diheme cytochrome c family protein